MTRLPALVGLAAAALAIMDLPAASEASVLCRYGRSLIVREQCKRREEPITPARQVELGMEGPQGPAGPIGPGTGDLKVLDATGHEVGLVLALRGYYGTADVVREMTLPGETAPEFVTVSVDAAGIGREGRCPGELFEGPTCAGTAYADCTFGDLCSSASGALVFVRQLYPTASGQACFVGNASEFRAGDFYASFRLRGFSVEELTARCQQFGGTLTEAPTECRPSSQVFCASCCSPQRSRSRIGIPVHTFDASLLGSPPFRLAR